MRLQIHYQGLDPSPWLEQFIGRRMAKLERYLSPSSSVQVNLRFENRKYSTGLAIHNHHDLAFTATGDNLYESFASAVEKATRVLSEEKRKIKDKINKKYFSVRRAA